MYIKYNIFTRNIRNYAKHVHIVTLKVKVENEYK